MRVPIVILALVATPFLADVSAAQSASKSQKELSGWEWLQKMYAERWEKARGKHDNDKHDKDKHDNDKCDKNGRNDKKDRDRDRDRDRHDARGRNHDDDRCDAPKPAPTPTPAPEPTPTPTPTPPPAANGAEVRGTLYADLNFNGARDAGEPALAGWTVELVGGGKTVVTDANGAYSITGVPVGSYFVCAAAQSGWSQIMPSRGDMCDAGGRAFTIDVLADAPNALFTGNDFSYTSAAGG